MHRDFSALLGEPMLYDATQSVASVSFLDVANIDAYIVSVLLYKEFSKDFYIISV